MAKRKQRPARHPRLPAGRAPSGWKCVIGQAGEALGGMGSDVKHNPAGFEGRSCLILSFEGKGNEVTDDLSLLEIQGLRLHLGLSYLGEKRVRACCVSLILDPGRRGYIY